MKENKIHFSIIENVQDLIIVDFFLYLLVFKQMHLEARNIALVNSPAISTKVTTSCLCASLIGCGNRDTNEVVSLTWSSRLIDKIIKINKNANKDI